MNRHNPDDAYNVFMFVVAALFAIIAIMALADELGRLVSGL